MKKWKPGPMTILQTSVQTSSFSTHMHAAAEMAKTLSKLQEHIQSCLANVKKKKYDLCSPTSGKSSSAFSKSVISNATDLFNQNE
ncbi:hypothetical protein Peur_017067 [Populus x canadensis]